jgi:hypothetical protein
MKDDIYHETLQKALDEKVIFQSYDGSGHRIYVRNAQTSLPW